MYCVQQLTFRHTKTSSSSFSFAMLGTMCPHCARSGWWQFDPPISKSDVLAEPRRVPCGGCGKSVAFYVVARPRENTSGWLWAHPSPAHDHAHRGEIATALAAIHPALREAYDEATATLASGHASSAANQARRTLEGRVKHLLEAEGEKVAARSVLDGLIRQLAKSRDLAKPLTDTAHAVREGGNLGSHYDTRTTATPELAARTVQLVEAIADYLLVLPTEVEAIKRLLDGEQREQPGDDNIADGF